MYFGLKFAILGAKMHDFWGKIKIFCKDSNFFSKKLAHIKKKQYYVFEYVGKFFKTPNIYARFRFVKNFKQAISSNCKSQFDSLLLTTR